MKKLDEPNFQATPTILLVFIIVVAGSSGLPASTKSLESLLKFVVYDVSVNYSGGDLGVPQSLLGQAQVFGFP